MLNQLFWLWIEILIRYCMCVWETLGLVLVVFTLAGWNREVVEFSVVM